MEEKDLVKISPENFTIGEIKFIEKLAGRAFTDALENLNGDTMAGLAACIIRRRDSTETTESALAKAENFTMGELLEAIDLGDQ